MAPRVAPHLHPFTLALCPPGTCGLAWVPVHGGYRLRSLSRYMYVEVAQSGGASSDLPASCGFIRRKTGQDLRPCNTHTLSRLTQLLPFIPEKGERKYQFENDDDGGVGGGGGGDDASGRERDAERQLPSVHQLVALFYHLERESRFKGETKIAAKKFQKGQNGNGVEAAAAPL